MSLGQNIKLLRKYFDITQKELSAIAGVCESAVSIWEADKTQPRMTTIQKIADHFGIKKSNIIEEGGMNEIINRPYGLNGVRDEIAMNLLFFRKQKGYTQKELAEKLGVSNSSVSNWEKGLNSIDIDTLHVACTVFGVSMNDMFGSFSNINEAINCVEEKKIIEIFRSFNEDGQAKLLDYAQDLVATDHYNRTSAEYPIQSE